MVPLLLLACAAPSGDSAAPSDGQCAIEAPDPGTLRVDGLRIVDQHDRVILLRGINAGGRSKFAPYLPFDFAEAGTGALPFDEALSTYLDRASAWGFSLLRVPFSWAALEPTPGSWDEGWADRFAALLDGAWDRGMWTIVDFHQDVYCEAFCGDGFPLWTLPGFDPEDPPETSHDCPDWFFGYLGDPDVDAAFDRFWADQDGVRSAWAAMWQEMIARHGDRPGVIGFEIINEPHRGSAEEGGWAAGTLSAFYGQQAAAFQAADPDAMVFFDSTGLDAVTATTSLERPEGEGLVFAPHLYDPSIFLGGEADPSTIAAGVARWAEQGAAWELPVLLGELGIQHDREGAGQTVRAHYDALDEAWMHATWWEYSEAEEDWNQEGLSVVGPGGEERRTILDELVRPYARALAGEHGSQRYDPELRRFDLEWNAVAGGVTEVVLPRWLGVGVDPRIEAEGSCWDLQGDRLLLRSGSGGPAAVTVTLP